MKNKSLIFCTLALVLGQFAAAQKFQLAKPQIRAEHQFFFDSTRVELFFDLDGAEIFYTFGTTGFSRSAQRYDGKPLRIASSCVLKARVFHPDFDSSELLIKQFYKMDKNARPVSSRLHKPPSPKFPGAGAATLSDLKKGSIGFGDGRWLGYEGESLVYDFSLAQKTEVKTLIVSWLVDPGAWIFPPRKVVVYASRKAKFNRKTAEVKLPAFREDQATGERVLFVHLKKRKYKHFRVRIENYGPLPDWHPGKGGKAWLFVDEVGVGE